MAKQQVTTKRDERHQSFGQSKVATMIHKNQKTFVVNKTLCWELQIILDALWAP